MAARRYVASATIPPERLISTGDLRAVERYEELRDTLASRVGPEAAKLFAEPLVTWGNGVTETKITWYAQRPGELEKLSDLDSGARAQAEEKLAGELRPVAEMASGDPLLSAALMIDSADDVLVIDGYPVLVNWGAAPVEAHVDGEARDKHFSETLGRLLPDIDPPSVSALKPMRDDADAAGSKAGAAALAGAGTASAAGAGVAAAGAIPGAANADPTLGAQPVGAGAGGGPRHPGGPEAPLTPDEHGRWRWRWIAPVTLAVLFALGAIWLLLPNTRIFPDAYAANTVDDAAVLNAARAANETLEDRIAQLRDAIDTAQCSPQGDLVLPGGVTPDGRAVAPPLSGPDGAAPPDGSTPPADSAAPSEEDQAARPAAPLLPPDASDVEIAPAEGEDPRSLLAALEEGVVLVLSTSPASPGNVSTGTGFFVAPDLIATNHHVIENMISGGDIFVTSEELGRVRPARLVASKGPMRETGSDLALLRIEDPVGAPLPILLSAESQKLNAVYAAGYPGMAVAQDTDYQRLLRGEDAAAAPDLVVTDGIVNAEQRLSDLTEAVLHTAHVSHGNSGGPLVDSCGRVLGVNTFIISDSESLNSLNYALSAKMLDDFLTENDAQHQTTSEPCAPRRTALAPAPAPAPSPAPAAPPVDSQAAPAPAPSPAPAPDGAAPTPTPQSPPAPAPSPDADQGAGASPSDNAASPPAAGQDGSGPDAGAQSGR